MKISIATIADIPKILELQKKAFLTEAAIINDYTISPLFQTEEEVESEFAEKTVFKAENENGEIVGSARIYEKENRIHITKLIIHPDYQNSGFGSKFLRSVEEHFPNKSFEIFTSERSPRNLHFYQKNGYKEFKREKASEGCQTKGEWNFVFMEK